VHFGNGARIWLPLESRYACDLTPPAYSSVSCARYFSVAGGSNSQKAITLLERANSISTPHEFASYEQVITFQSFTPTGTQSGRFTSVVHGPRSYRDEYEFGDFDLLVVVNGSLIADVGDRAKAPLEVRRRTRRNQPYTARFDQSDIIRSIASKIPLKEAGQAGSIFENRIWF
jgi:hypothetical protein